MKILQAMPSTEITHIPTLSVVVPVFNDEQYLGQNLKSILANAGSVDIEIIVVDDGSTDRSSEVAEKVLVESDVNFKIIRKPNGGLSSARNVGFRAAEGIYVAFLDSDDFVSGTMYRSLTDFASKTGSVQVFARTKTFNNNDNTCQDFYDISYWDELLQGQSRRSFRPLESPLVFLTQPKICTRIWLREYLIRHKFEFPEGKVFEDICFHLRALALNGKVGIVDEVGLYYREDHTGRITGNIGPERYDVLDNACKFLNLQEISAVDRLHGGYLLAGLLKTVFWCRIGLPSNMKKEFDKRVARLFPMINPKWILEAYGVDHKVINRLLKVVSIYGTPPDRLRGILLWVGVRLKRMAPEKLLD
ncbi:glycosyltransferase [Ruegeria sp. HU-ET01832]|uniref:glycosyltransferase family 2 protein n=1 Tax=Ruegeria sp. HU-ET01832 TaxID=3135906 RepID=UPI0033428E3D